MRLARVMHDQARTGDRANEMMELLLDRCDIRIDVSVIVLEIIEDQRARSVMDKFRALVEERRIVFIRLDHEERALTQASAYPKIFGYAADQKTW